MFDADSVGGLGNEDGSSEEVKGWLDESERSRDV